MATIRAKAVVATASELLQDVGQVRWTAKTLLGYLNDGQREIVLLRPDAGAKTVPLGLVAGTRQVLPDDGIRLITVMRNLKPDLSAGKAVTIIEREELDAIDPNWHAAAAASSIDHYVFDGRNPTAFYVYPPALAATKLEAVYQANPVDCTITNVGGGGSDSTISLNDIYQTALIEYLLHKAFEAQTDARDTRKASDHYNLFLKRLGLKTSADKVNDPNKNSPPAEVRRQQETPASGPAF